jgi:hypothetical protein
VRITVTHGARRIARKVLKLRSDCSFRSTFAAGGRIKVAVRFLGTPTLAAASLSRIRRVH